MVVSDVNVTKRNLYGKELFFNRLGYIALQVNFETMHRGRMAENMSALITDSKPIWKTRLFCINQQLSEVTGKRSILQGDPWSPLSFIAT